MSESEITGKKGGEVEEEEDDETESKELSDKLTFLSMKSWLSLTHPLSSNAISLSEEAEEVIPKIESFIASLELFSNVTGSKRFRRMKFKEESHTAKVLERILNERIELGMFIVSRVSDLLHLERQTFGRNPYRERSSSSTNEKPKGSLQEYEATLQKVIRRFIRILDSKGIQHNLERELLFRPTYNEEIKPYPLTAPFPQIDEPIIEEPTPPQEDEQEEKEVSNAIEFLNRVVSRNNLSIMFRNIPNKDSNSYEYFCACDFDQFTVSAKGPSRLTARINSAAKMIKLIMREQQKGNSISMEKFVLLSDDEIETAIRILCITDNYANKLRKVCEMHTAHSPKFMTVCEKPIYTVRCEALGYKAIGTHKKQYMAKKIAAKKLLMQMPNEGEPKSAHPEYYLKPTYRVDKKAKIVQTYRESSLN